MKARPADVTLDLEMKEMMIDVEVKVKNDAWQLEKTVNSTANVAKDKLRSGIKNVIKGSGASTAGIFISQAWWKYVFSPAGSWGGRTGHLCVGWAATAASLATLWTIAYSAREAFDISSAISKYIKAKTNRNAFCKAPDVAHKLMILDKLGL